MTNRKSGYWKSVGLVVLAMGCPSLILAGEEQIQALGKNEEKSAIVGTVAEVLEKSETKTMTTSAQIAAIVDKRILTVHEILQDIKPLLVQIKQETKTIEDFKRKAQLLYQEHLQAVVDRILVVNYFHKEGHKLNRMGIDDQLDENIKQGFGGNREAFLKYLDNQGKTLRQYRQEMEEYMIVSAMKEYKQRSQVEISPGKVKQYYDEHKQDFLREPSVHIRQITLEKKANETGEDSFKHLQTVLDELKKGVSFAEVAQKYSVDNKKEQGGDWGWVVKADLLPELSQAAFALKIGEHSAPVYIGNYALIVSVQDRKEGGYILLEEAKKAIEKLLAQQLSNQNYQNWVDQLRKDAFIKYFPQPEFSF